MVGWRLICRLQSPAGVQCASTHLVRCYGQEPRWFLTLGSAPLRLAGMVPVRCGGSCCVRWPFGSSAGLGGRMAAAGLQVGGWLVRS